MYLEQLALGMLFEQLVACYDGGLVGTGVERICGLLVVARVETDSTHHRLDEFDDPKRLRTFL